MNSRVAGSVPNALPWVSDKGAFFWLATPINGAGFYPAVAEPPGY